MSARNIYIDRNRLDFLAEQKDGAVEDPISMEELPAYLPGKTILCLALTEDNKPVRQRIYDINSLHTLVSMSNRDPFTNKPWKGNPRARAEIQLRAHGLPALDAEEVATLFREYIKEPYVFKRVKPVAYDLLRRDMHMGDGKIITTWEGDNLREKAMACLHASAAGTWLIRNSSVKSTELVTIQAISFVVSAGTPLVPAKIINILIMHCRGYGYTIIQPERGQIMPNLGDDVALPKHDEVFGSFIDVMNWIHTNVKTFKISEMKINEVIEK
jgi:hypothetical protein